MAETAQTKSQCLASCSSFKQYVDLSATVWALKTTSDFHITANSVDERRLTSNATLMAEKRNI